ncbi:MAG: GIY-YIG nuclease family protein, partial [Roseiflexaceae bacterium]
MTTNNGFAITIFLPNGDPDGVKEVTKGNWIGHGLVIPRTLFNEAKKRPELKQTGVYLLVEASAPKIYIGEGDPVGPRLEQHAQTKDFWTHAVIFTSSAQNLHKTHIQYLESKLVQLAHHTKHAYLDNGNIPQLPTTSAIIRSEAENFLQDMLMCLPLLGYSYFRTANQVAGNTQTQHTQPILFQLKSESKSIHASGYEVSGGFVVQKGSYAVLDNQTVNSLSTGIRKLRADLVARHVLIPQGAHYLFAIDY